MSEAQVIERGTTGERSSRTPPDRRYADLVQRVKAAGLMERRSGLYILRTAATFAFLIGTFALVAVVGDSWWQLAVAVLAAVAFTQIAFLGHDAGHRQAFRSRRANDIMLLACANLTIGVASGWWFGNHNRHHAHPNHTDLDPDVGLRFFAYSHEQGEAKSGLDRFVARYQHAPYFPLLSLLGFSLHIESVAVVLRKGVKRPVTEGALLALHFAAYFTAIAMTMSPLKALAFVLVHQVVFGLYLGSTFAPNHKGMEMFSDDEPTFLDRQVLTSRNVSGGPVMDYLLGGLNLQIEHHLFPSMPRPNLSRARKIVKPFCEEVGLPYAEHSLWSSFREVVRHFRNTRSS